MTDPLDRLVKGAPPPDMSANQVAANAKSSRSPSPASSSSTSSSSSPPSPPSTLPDNPSARSITAPIPPSQNPLHHPHHHSPNSSVSSLPHDPRDALPSSPPQIYLNLLILESSLRLQYLSLRARLRLHLLLFSLLAAWVAVFSYLLFLRPREDGSGVGGSVYWVLESAEKLGWCSGIVTSALFAGTGMYHRGVRWPRRFVATTNRGLRGFNLKVVVVRGGSWAAELKGWLAVVDLFGWFREARMNFQIVPRDIEAATATTTTGAGVRDHWNAHAAKHGIVEEDVAPGGDVLRVLLLPKPFSGDFREGWDNFRLEYWEKENARRASLRALVRARHREVARAEGGWLWWTGWRGWHNVRFFTSRKTRRQVELERLALREKPPRERKRRESVLRDASHSRTSSRSSTPDPDARNSRLTDEKRPRRGSSTHSNGATGTRRPRRAGGSINEKSRLSATETLLQGVDADFQSSARLKRLSTINTGSDDQKAEGTSPLASRPLTPTFADEIKAEPAEA